MKSVKIGELKTHLSRYLLRVRKGERLIVLDRNEPIAELIPIRASPKSIVERLAREGKLRRGSQDWSKVRISKLKKRVPIQEILADVLGD